jgi:hypothetical protein
MSSIQFSLHFYADTAKDSNKLYNWKIPSVTSGVKAIPRFQKLGYHIRAAWIKKSIGSSVLKSLRII